MQSPDESLKPAVSRRQFLGRTLAGGAGCAAGLLGYAYFIEPHRVVVEQRSLPIANLPDTLVGKRLVQISDIHVGENLNPRYIARAISSINDLDVDMIVITGDFMTCEGEERVDETVDVMRRLPRAPLGTFAVLGNHDYGVDWRQFAAADRLVRGLDKIDVQVLRNEVVSAEGLHIVGVDDLWAAECRPGPTLRQVPTGAPSLVLCHNPDAVDMPQWGRYEGWILAGHTHGGQCKPPWLDPPVLPVRNKRYTAGEFQLSGNRRLYINRGLGYVRRVRFNCPPEITVFTLERELPA